jgi:hypothetical protein
VIASKPVRRLLISWDIRPTASEIREKMNSLEDDYMINRSGSRTIFRAKNANHLAPKKSQPMSPILLDTSLETFVLPSQTSMKGQIASDSQESSYP